MAREIDQLQFSTAQKIVKRMLTRYSDDDDDDDDADESTEC